MQRRPTGVTLAAVALGLLSLLTFFGGVVYGVVGLLITRTPGFPPTAPGQTPPPAGLMEGIFVFFALIALACATWGFLTTYGVIKMRNWARISTIIIGVCVAGLSLLELFGMVIMQVAMPALLASTNAQTANQAPVDPHALQAVFFVGDAFCIGFMALGVWWLVYFVLRRTREAFKLAALNVPLSHTGQLNPRGPITDFSVAQPIIATEAAAEDPTIPVEPEVPGRPISMIVVAVLMFLAAFSVLFCCVLPYPMFFFGVQVSGWSAHIIAISLAALYALGGFGLLRRMHFGWVLAVGVQCIGLLNILTMLSPPIRERWLAYTREMVHSMQPAVPGAAAPQMQMMQEKMMSAIIAPSLILGVLISIFFLVLLWRARWWYKADSEQ